MRIEQLIQIIRLYATNTYRPNRDKILEGINIVAGEITDKLEFINFLNQSACDTGGWLNFVEDEDYFTSVSKLVKAYPDFFTKRYRPAAYLKNPRKLLSLVYADKFGNGNVKSEDGYIYRYRGAIAIIGRTQYTYCSRDLFEDDRLVKNPDMILKDIPLAFRVGLWRWNNLRCGYHINEDNFNKICRIFKDTGKDEMLYRNQQYQKLKQLLLD